MTMRAESQRQPWTVNADIQRSKRIFLRICKYLGLFLLSKWMTRHAVRVLCYHGFNMLDEGQFRPRLFIPPELFDKRLAFLSDHGFPVLPLSSAESALSNNSKLPNCTTVITIDDGWYSTHAIAMPLLTKRSMPATLYVTTYYMGRQAPVFGVCIAYLFWKSDARAIDLSGVDVPTLKKPHDTSVTVTPSLIEEIVRYGERECDEEGRSAILEQLALALQIDVDNVIKSRILSLINDAELKEIIAAGVDIQLHTHRHRFPLDAELASRELDDNRAVLTRATEKPLNHFCYPSGNWVPEHWAVLEKNGVKSATTCDPGLVYRNTPLLSLPRIMDTVDMSSIEFEAEMYGFTDIIRRTLSWVRTRRK